MDVSHILDSLNDQQRYAVASPAPYLLVLAGAGSGKTRVLVHRIAWLLQAENVSPFAILAVTFTNKAAREMRSRIGELMAQSMGGMWVGTFHGLAHRLLRMHWQEAGLLEDDARGLRAQEAAKAAERNAEAAPRAGRHVVQGANAVFGRKVVRPGVAANGHAQRTPAVHLRRTT